MTADRGLAPGTTVTLTTRLGDRARPAGGRPPVNRYAYGACTLDALEDARADLTARLTARVGPLRCTDVALEVAVGLQHAADLLHDLHAHRGQGLGTLAPVVNAIGLVAARAAQFDAGDPVLVVASCGALTGQASAAVGAS